MQVYRGMDIGTAKPSLVERTEVPHHLIDLVDPNDEYTVAQFQHDARAAINAIEARGNRAVLVGGTALYLRAVVDGLTIPGQFPDARARIEKQKDTAALHARLRELDPAAAGRMEPTNRRRIVRALEVTEGSGRPFSSFGPGLEAHPATPFSLVGIAIDREEVDRLIEERFRAMVDAGLVEEVRSLLGRIAIARTARQALGYREILGHVEDGVALDDAVAEAIRRTRAFARRQQAWFRRDPRITWYAHNTVALSEQVLGDWWPRWPS